MDARPKLPDDRQGAALRARAEWLAAARLAPRIKTGYHTVLDQRDWLPEIRRLLHEDSRLQRVFGGAGTA